MANNLNSVIHSPVRLAIMAYLQKVTQSEYGHLKEVVGVNSPELSRQLRILSDNDLVHCWSRNGGSRTVAVGLSEKGEREFRKYLKSLDKILQVPEV